MQASESSFEIYKLTRILFFANFICSSVSGPKALKKGFSESDFWTITPHFLNPISKMFCNFSLQLNLEKRRHVFFFSAFGPETDGQI